MNPLKYFTFFVMVLCANGIMLSVPPQGKRCLKEEIQKGVLVTGDYSLSDPDHERVDLIIKDTKGHILLSRENIGQGKIAFNTDEHDVFEICFISQLTKGQVGTPREVTFDLKHGTEGINYDNIAEVGKLKPLEIELQKLEHLSQGIVKDFAHMKIREEEMRNTNESTNSRVLFFSVFSMGCLLFLAGGQVLYMKKFFKSKKLIE